MNKLKDFMYSLGNFSASILGQTVSTFAIYFYVDVMKVPTKMISIVMFCYGIWNAINDPLFGQISDKPEHGGEGAYRTLQGLRCLYV